jgi:predicted transcriptional regulator
MSLLWSDEEYEALVNLAKAGYSLREIVNSGIFVNRTEASITKYAFKMNVKLAGQVPHLDKDKLKELLHGSNRK